MPAEDRLDSWKEIAAYLKRDVTTVQRWEKRERMPVHRHVHDKLGSIYAFRSELDAWTLSRNLRTTSDEPQAEPLDRLEVSTVDGSATGPATSAAPDTTPSARTRSTPVWAVAAGVMLLAVGAIWWRLERTDYFWQNPLNDAQFQTVTDFDGTEQAATISRDGRFVAFVSERDGRMDVWVTQLGTGRFYNLTHGQIPELVNPSIRTLGFSPDGTLVTFWAGGTDTSGARHISIWAVPTLGGPPRPYLEGVAEFDWSSDGARLVYHTAGPGDPTFVRESGGRTEDLRIFTAASGLHGHFPLWGPSDTFVYFVQGSMPDNALSAADIWRVRPTGGAAERITDHNAAVSHPVLLNRRTLMYLATDRDGSGPWLYSIDVEHRIAHRLSAGPDRYTSLAASSDGRRIVATIANPKRTLWSLPIGDTSLDSSAETPTVLATARGFSPRFGPGYLLYVSSKGAADAIWKLADGRATELWSAAEARIVGGPDVTSDGQRVVFSVEQRGRTLLYVINADGTNARLVTGSLELRGSPAWAPDGQSITSAVNTRGTPHLFRISVHGETAPLVQQYAVDPVWSPAGDFLVYSGADVGTTFPVKAVTADARPYPLPDLTLTRGARRLRFIRGRRALVVLRGDIRHKNLWIIDLDTAAERQLTNLPPDFDVRDFDVSPDGRKMVLERVQQHSDIVLIDLAHTR